MQRTEAIRSRKYLDGANGGNCTLRFDGCRNERETVVSCHLHNSSFGMARKADDLSVVDGCWRCHSALDLHTHGLPAAELYQVLFRALQETLRARWERGLLVIPLDTPKSFHSKATPQRLPKSQRKPVGPSRPMQSRNNLRKRVQ